MDFSEVDFLSKWLFSFLLILFGLEFPFIEMCWRDVEDLWSLIAAKRQFMAVISLRLHF